MTSMDQQMTVSKTARNGIVWETRPQQELVEIDPTRIKALVLSREEGWTDERFEVAFLEYRRFFTMCKEYPLESIMAPEDVDVIWHNHMLDSRWYAEDCRRILGKRRFLHHDPCIGEPNMHNTELTLGLYQKEFKVKPGEDWRSMRLTCAGSGGGCGSISTLSLRTVH